MNYDLLTSEIKHLLPDKEIAVKNTISSTNCIVKAVFIEDKHYIIDEIVPCAFTEKRAAGLIAEKYLL